MKLLSCMSAQMHGFSCLCFSIPPHVRTNWCNSTRLDLNREDGAYLWLLLESSPSLDPTEQEQKTLYIWLKEKVSVATLHYWFTSNEESKYNSNNNNNNNKQSYKHVNMVCQVIVKTDLALLLIFPSRLYCFSLKAGKKAKFYRQHIFLISVPCHIACDKW